MKEVKRVVVDNLGAIILHRNFMERERGEKESYDFTKIHSVLILKKHDYKLFDYRMEEST